MRFESNKSDVIRKKDFSTAILDRKKAPNKLQVEDSKQDDNSIVEMTQAKMDELKIFKGDTVILRGKFLTDSNSIGPLSDDSFPLNVVIVSTRVWTVAGHADGSLHLGPFADKTKIICLTSEANQHHSNMRTLLKQ